MDHDNDSVLRPITPKADLESGVSLLSLRLSWEELWGEIDW